MRILEKTNGLSIETWCRKHTSSHLQEGFAEAKQRSAADKRLKIDIMLPIV